MHIRSLYSRIITGALALIMMISVLGSFSPVKAYGEVVKVGYYYAEGFQNGCDKEAVKSGYGYDYIQKIAYSTGWQLEYVYGNWEQIYAKFLRGEVDIVLGMSYMDSRASRMLFPNDDMGTEAYYIYKHDYDNTTNNNVFKTMSGKRIGTIKNSSMAEYLQEFIDKNEVNLEVIYYDGFAERDKDFINGKLDYITATGNNASKSIKISAVTKIGESDYYIAVVNSRPDLIKDLNEAQTELLKTEPFYKVYLQNQYFTSSNTKVSINSDEKEWLVKHTKIRFGYLNDYLPYCTMDEDGNPKGIITDVVDEFLDELELEHSLAVEYVCFDSYDEMLEGLHSESVDVIFPEVNSTWYSEKNSVFETNTVVSTPLTLLCLGEYSSSTLNRIAISGHSPMQKIAAELYFPDSEIIQVESARACLDAVLDGEADSTIFNGYRAYYFLNQRPYSSINEIQLNNSLYYCFGVNKSDSALLSLLNKGLVELDEDTLATMLLQYTEYNEDVSVWDFVHKHTAFAIWILGTIILLIILVFVVYIAGQRGKKKQMLRALKEKEEQLIIEQQLTEEIRQAKEKAEDANNAKTVFLFNMSHDIRTPMNAIIGFTDLLEKNQDDADKRGDYLRKIKYSSSVLLSIINNVLEMARIEKGTLVLNETVWNVEQFMDAQYSIFQAMMEEKSIEFLKSYDVQHKYVYCDTLKLKEIFINIISNAYKYTNSGGKVSLSVIECPSEKEGYVVYKTIVEDTGIGMSEEFLPHLFEEFSREHNTTENKIEGTGLGMPIVKRLVDFLGGTIEVESKKNVGTKFTVIMTYRIAEKENSVEHEDFDFNMEKYRGKRILLAEDNDLNAEIAIELLSSFGVEVERASDGQICVDMVKKAGPEHFNLILMDVQMPNLNGYDATTQIRQLENQAKASIPILAMTANAFEEDKKHALNAGMNGHLGKPIDVKELLKNLSLFFN